MIVILQGKVPGLKFDFDYLNCVFDSAAFDLKQFFFFLNLRNCNFFPFYQ